MISFVEVDLVWFDPPSLNSVGTFRTHDDEELGWFGVIRCPGNGLRTVPFKALEIYDPRERIDLTGEEKRLFADAIAGHMRQAE